MTETYFQSLQRENHEYALQVETLIQQVQNLNGLLDEKYHIIARLRGELMEVQVVDRDDVSLVWDALSEFADETVKISEKDIEHWLDKRRAEVNPKKERIGNESQTSVR